MDHPDGRLFLVRYFLSNLYHKPVDLHHVNVFNFLILCQFPDHPAVSGSDHKNVLNPWMHSHRHMGDHLMINKFVFLCHHHIAV
ncbi:hypothetical protein EVA_10478 [gut metagenome]|uniref:Uncharacterized protein n=1 Tax=gut metagenome TaxID=749906 RepID=J9G2G2_9ZZZZ